MNVLICGSRDWDSFSVIDAVLDTLDPKRDTIIHGDCRGADKLADTAARRRGFDVQVYPADWRGQGRGAGPARNLVMLKEGRPDVVHAFKRLSDFNIDLSRGGTENMVKIASEAGVTSYVHFGRFSFIYTQKAELAVTQRFAAPGPFKKGA